MQTIVFLDFDDVLAIHPEHTSQRVVTALRSGSAGDFTELWANVFHDALKANLRTLYDEFHPQFVISSTWSTYLSRAEVSDVLIRGGLGFVGAALHLDWRSATEVGSFRASDISSWIARQGRLLGLTYVILDDTSSGHTLYGTALEPHVVFCDEWQGFVALRLEQARAILRQQLHSKSLPGANLPRCS